MKLPGFVRRIVPRYVRERLYGPWTRWQGLRFRCALAHRSLDVPRSGIHVSYGEIMPRIPGAIVHGGRVKLTHLEGAFPPQDRSFNILYLVSSAQPPFVLEYARCAKARGARLVWNQNGVAYPAWAGAGHAEVNATMRAVRAIADYVIYQSEFCRTSADRYLGTAAPPWEIVYNCVDTDRFVPADPAPAGNTWVLLAIGSHQQPERVWSTLETLAYLRQAGRDARLILAGRLDWPDAVSQTQAAIERLSLGTAVELVPAYTQDAAPALYRRAHVLLHTKYKDPCPTVVLEALACGLPVVGSASGGMPELVGEDGGILIDVPDDWARMHYPATARLAGAIEAIMCDLARWRALARASAVQRFGAEAWVARHRAIFGKVVLGSD